jgi:hypothetical protein
MLRVNDIKVSIIEWFAINRFAGGDLIFRQTTIAENEAPTGQTTLMPSSWSRCRREGRVGMC